MFEGINMHNDIRNNEKIKIKKISIEGINLKNLLNPEFIDKMENESNECSLLNLAIILGENKPSNLITVGHISSEDYRNDILTVRAESEDKLKEFLKLL